MRDGGGWEQVAAPEVLHGVVRFTAAITSMHRKVLPLFADTHVYPMAIRAELEEQLI